MKTTHLVTLLTCFELSLSLPLSGNRRPVTSTSTTRATIPDSIIHSTTAARTMTSSTQGIKVETTIATEVTSSTAIDVTTTHSAKTTETSSPSVGTKRLHTAKETSVAGTAAAPVTLNRLRRTNLETTRIASSTVASREMPASIVNPTVTSKPTASARRGATRDPRCIVRSTDFRPHSIDSAPDANIEAAVEERAMCKFEYTANTDRLRHPQKMPAVVCPAKRCGHCGGNGRCEPVYHSFQVLRRCDDLDDAGYYLYRYDYERLAVACVCATPALTGRRPVMPVRPDSEDDGPTPVLD